MATIHIKDLQIADSANLFDVFLIQKFVANYSVMYQQTLSSLEQVLLPVNKIMSLYNLLSSFENNIEAVIANRLTKDSIDTEYESLTYIKKEDASFYKSLILTRDKLKSIIESKYIDYMTLSNDVIDVKNQYQTMIAHSAAEIAKFASTSKFGLANTTSLETISETIEATGDIIAASAIESGKE